MVAMSSHFRSPEVVDRWLTSRLREAVAEHPVVILTGARQVGKSTLLRGIEPFASWRYLSFDDLSLVEQARIRPEALWAGVESIVLDEVQKAPEVLNAVKLAVDESRRERRFLLSGSANLLLMQHVGESLAGRAVYTTLEPMALGELTGESATAPVDKLEDLLSGRFPADTEIDPIDPLPHLLRGFMPALLPFQTIADPRRRAAAVLRWWEGYVGTYLERDLRQLSQVSSLVDFRKLMELLALRSGHLLNQSELGRDARLPQPTVNRYLNLLEASHLFQRLPAYTSSRTTRLLKSPRIFWSDPALAVFLAGYFDLDSLKKSRELGFFFETLVFLHLRILAAELAPRAQLFSWRTPKGAEIDFVVEHGRRLLGVEVKMADEVSHRDTEGLRLFLESTPGAFGVLVYTGRRIRRLDEKIVAVPWNWFAR